MKIYTRTGDGGSTTLFDGTRIAKSDPRVEAYGEVDEANAALGAARSEGLDPDIDAVLDRVQRDLFALGSRLADPAERIADRVTKILLGPDDVARLEGWIDTYEAELPPLRSFVLPGGTRAASALHLARTVCRRAERRMVALVAVEVEFLAYMNRLSDLLFVLTRVVNKRAGTPEVEW
jgi:cob(I)alamin adenosyltransferase